MKTVKKVELEIVVGGRPRIIEFELPSSIASKDVDVYLRGITDLLATLEANTQSRTLDNVLDVINRKGIVAEDN